MTYTGNNKKKILFLGGSITCGANSTDYENSWARKTFHGIAHELYGENVEMINASISGTTSHVAVFRLQEHVLKYCPDLVFVEFAVNDFSFSKDAPDLVVSCMDHIVRELIRTNPNVAIIFVYTTLRGQNAAATHTLVAKHYGIPEIDLQTPMQAEVDAGNKTWDDFLADAAHPKDEGHAFYADLVIKTILADKERYLAPVSLKTSVAKYPFKNPCIVSAEKAVMNGFGIVPAQDRGRLKHMDELVITHAVSSNRVGDTLTFEFEGEHFGLYHRIGNYGGKFTVTIDGKEMGGADTYYCYGDGTGTLGEFISCFYAFDLGKGKHTAVVTVAEPNPNSKDSDVCIAGAFVG